MSSSEHPSAPIPAEARKQKKVARDTVATSPSECAGGAGTGMGASGDPRGSPAPAAVAPSPAPTTKLAKLRSIEESMQAIWASTHAFDSDAPVEASASSGSGGKFFVTFPFPYCNGRTHLYVNC
jgi:hypothetical protein